MAATVKKMKGLTFERPCDKSKSSHKGIKRIFKELSPADWAVANKKTKKRKAFSEFSTGCSGVSHRDFVP